MALNATVRQLNGAPQLEPAQTMVAINKVTMSFGEFTAVRDVDIQVGDGEFLAIVGPTGCGKSTILNSVAGLLKPSSGDVAIDGRTVSGVQESVGYLFQQDALLPWKTAFQNVELGLRFRGVPEAERKAKANAWLAKVGLAGFEHRYPHQLSGGQRKRVQMAQALIVEPKVIHPARAGGRRVRRLGRRYRAGRDRSVLLPFADGHRAAGLDLVVRYLVLPACLHHPY